MTARSASATPRPLWCWISRSREVQTMRRLFLLVVAAIAVGGQLCPAVAQAVDPSELMKPGPLSEKVL